MALGPDQEGELSVLAENLWLAPASAASPASERTLSPELRSPRDALVAAEGSRTPAGWRKVVTKKASGNDHFMAETTGWNNPFRPGLRRLAVANLPEDEERFPVATYARRLLVEGTQHLALPAEAMRRPAPPGSPREFQPDGSNLPWPVEELGVRNPEGFERWIEHARTVLPDLRTVETVERKEDKHRYLCVVYGTGLPVPSWNLSEARCASSH